MKKLGIPLVISVLLWVGTISHKGMMPLLEHKKEELMNKNQLRDLIREVLMDIGLHSDAAEDLIIGTFAQESHLGKYIKQIGRGPALGVGQMEPATHNDIWNNYLKYKTKRSWFKAMKEKYVVMPIDGGTPDPQQLKWSLGYMVCMTRVHYLRVSERLPNEGDLAGYARYWKKYYNSYLGAGTPEEFLNNWSRFGL
jgi:hypothetical protein